MLRAVARGECVIFVDALVSPGIRVQHSAWLIAGSGALFATWHFAQGQWTETRSYLVATKDMAALAELLSRAVGSRS
jgi:hypothetical protein